MTEYAEEEDDAFSSVNGLSTGSSLLRLPNPNADKANRHHGRPLEALLMSKNRKLSEGMTKLRVSRRFVNRCEIR